MSTQRYAKTDTGISLPPSGAEVRTLDNGLEVILQEDRAHPLASVQIWVRAGSLHEEKWTGAGMAHLVEHMLFKGTAKRNAQQISQSIQERGGYVNAYTSFNRTVYWIDGLAEQVDGYLDVLSDMARRSRFDASELAREMDVIRREMAMDNDDPSSAVQHSMQATAFRKHPLRHPVIGHREVFDQVKREDVVAFVTRHYSPNNSFVVIAGDIDKEAAFASVKKHFGDWKRQPYEAVLLPDEPRQQSPRRIGKTFPSELTRIALGWQIPGETSEEKAALDVLAFLLGSGRSSRLYQELREKRGIAHSVWAGAWCAQECGLFSVEVECDPADAEAAEKSALEVIEKMKARGPTPSELAKAVRSTLGGQLRSLATVRGQASSLGNGWLMAGSLDLASIYLSAIKKLTPAIISGVARRHLDLQRINVVVVKPEGAAATTTRNAVAASSVKIERIILKNGLTLIIGENARLPLVSMRMQFLAGVTAETDANAGATQVTAQMLLKGTRTRSAEEIATLLENRGGGLVSQGDAHRLVIGADVMRGDEELGLDLIADLALNATLPKEQLAQVKKRQLAAIREEQEDPLTVALRLCRKKVFAGSPFERTALGTEESIARLTVEDCRKHAASHINAGNGVISIFGDISAPRMKALVEKTFAKLPPGKRERAAPPVFDSTGKPGKWEQQLDKEQATLAIGFRTVGLHDADTHALGLIDEACSDMGSRLFNRIREELGLAYYVGAQSFAALGAGAFYFYVGTDAKKLDLARNEMLQQIADLAKRGLTADELDRAKTTWRSHWLRQQQGNNALADGTAWDELNGLGHQHFEQLPDLIAAVTIKDIRRVAAKFFAAKDAFVVSVVPGRK